MFDRNAPPLGNQQDHPARVAHQDRCPRVFVVGVELLDSANIRLEFLHQLIEFRFQLNQTMGQRGFHRQTNDAAVNQFGAPTAGAGPKGPFSKELGSLAYFEICDRIKEGSLTPTTNKDCQCTYATNGNFWVGYDDLDSVTRKVNLFIFY